MSGFYLCILNPMKSIIEASPISQVPNALWHLLWGKMPNWYLGLGLFDVNLVSNLGGFGVCEDMPGCCPLHSEHISRMQCFDISFFLSIHIKPKYIKIIFTTSACIFKFDEREPSQTIWFFPSETCCNQQIDLQKPWELCCISTAWQLHTWSLFLMKTNTDNFFSYSWTVFV